MGSWCQHRSNVGCRDGLLTDADARDVDLAPAPAPQTREGVGQTSLGLSRLGLGAEIGHVVGQAGGPELAVGPGIDMGADVLYSGEQVIHFAAQIFVRVLQVLVPLAELETASEVEQVIVGDWETFRPLGLCQALGRLFFCAHLDPEWANPGRTQFRGMVDGLSGVAPIRCKFDPRTTKREGSYHRLFTLLHRVWALTMGPGSLMGRNPSSAHWMADMCLVLGGWSVTDVSPGLSSASFRNQDHWLPNSCWPNCPSASSSPTQGVSPSSGAILDEHRHQLFQMPEHTSWFQEPTPYWFKGLLCRTLPDSAAQPHSWRSLGAVAGILGEARSQIQCAGQPDLKRR